MRFAAAPEYQVFPTRARPLKPYEAAVRAARRDAAAGRRGAARRGRGGHPHARAGARRGARGRADRDARAARLPARGAGLPALLARARGCPGRGSGARLWRRLERPVDGGLRRGREELNGARDAPRPAAAGARARRDQRGGCASSGRSRSSSTRGPGRRRSTSPGRCCGSRRPRRSSCRRATRRWCWSRPRRPRIPSTACCAPLCGASPARRCGCSRPGTAARRRGRSTCRPTRGWSSGSPTRARCRGATSCSATAATGRSRARSPPAAAVVIAPAGGDMNENAARADWAGVGVRRAVAVRHPDDGAAGGRAGARGRADAASARTRAGGVVGRTTTARRARRSWWRSSPEGAVTGRPRHGRLRRLRSGVSSHSAERAAA